MYSTVSVNPRPPLNCARYPVRYGTPWVRYGTILVLVRVPYSYSYSTRTRTGSSRSTPYGYVVRNWGGVGGFQYISENEGLENRLGRHGQGNNLSDSIWRRGRILVKRQVEFYSADSVRRPPRPVGCLRASPTPGVRPEELIPGPQTLLLGLFPIEIHWLADHVVAPKIRSTLLNGASHKR